MSGPTPPSRSEAGPGDRPAPTIGPRVEHVAVWVRDLETTRAFYETHFGAEAGPRYHNPAKRFTSYFLRFQEGARLELMHRPDLAPAEPDAPGFAHIAFSLGSQQAVNEFARRLAAAGHPPVDGPRWTGDGYYEAVVLDPERNRIELTV